MASSENKVLVTFGVLIVIGASMVSFITLTDEMERNSSFDHIQDHDDIDLLRCEWAPNDHSVFRGYQPEQALEKVRRVLGSPEIMEAIDLTNVPFERDVQYRCEDGTLILMRTSFHADNKVSYSFWIEMSDQGIDKVVYGPEHALDVTGDLMDRFLEEFEYNDPDGFVMEVTEKSRDWNSWKVDIDPVLDGARLVGGSMEVRVDYNTGKIRGINIWDWIYVYEIENIQFDWIDANEEIMDSLNRLNNTMEFFISMEPEPNHSTGWSEFVSIEVDEEDLLYGGLQPILGRLCIATVLYVEVDGSFSNSFSSVNNPDPRTIYYNGTVEGTNTWFFDVETGRLLRWTLWSEKGGTEFDFSENLEGDNISWYDHVIQFEDYF